MFHLISTEIEENCALFIWIMISGLCGSLFMASWSTSDVKEEVENIFFSGQSKSDDKALCSVGMCCKGTSSWGGIRNLCPQSLPAAARC